jgi:hypothetical protein
MNGEILNNVACLVRGGTVQRLVSSRSLLSRAGLPGSRFVALCSVIVSVGTVGLHAAKNPDKFEKPAKIEKFERKLERAGIAESLEPELRQAMAATAPERSSKSDRSERSSKPDRGDRSESSDRGPALPADPKFDGFRLIVERNIFNPNRAPRSKAAPEEKPPRIEEISLVGTMRYDKGLVAFFDSPDPGYRRNLREGEMIAGFKVQRIAADGVELVRDDQPISLKVAEQLRRREGGDWTVNAAEPRVDARNAAGTEAVRAAAEAAAAEIPADAPEALKRLMEKRKQQLSK